MRVYVLLDVRSDDGVEVVGVYERERDALKDAWEMLVGDTTAFRWDGDEDTCPRDQTWVVSESLVASGGKEKVAFVVSGYDLIASSGEDA